jgi:hypothetical protein
VADLLKPTRTDAISTLLGRYAAAFFGAIWRCCADPPGWPVCRSRAWRADKYFATLAEEFIALEHLSAGRGNATEDFA